MTRLITKAALLSACGMLVAAAAMAGVPSASTSTAPSVVRLVVAKAGVADSLSGKFTVIVRDLASNFVIGSNVVVDFSGCTTVDIRLANNQLNPNYTLNCAGKTVAAFTNTSGEVAFTLVGHSLGDGTVPHLGNGCARIYADGVLLSSPTAATYDMNGLSGVGGADNSLYLNDLGAFVGPPFVLRGRSNFDGNLLISGGDTSIFLAGLGRANILPASVSATACL